MSGLSTYTFRLCSLFSALFSALLLISCGGGEEKFVCDPATVSVRGRAEENLSIRGSFSAWIKVPMHYENGVWSIELPIAPGNYPYEFYSEASKSYYNDPENPLTMFDKDHRYSRLVVTDCRYPSIRLKERVSVSGGKISFKIAYTPGVTGSGPDFGKSEILLNNKKADFEYDKKTGLLSFDHVAAASGKYTWFFKIFDTAGYAAEILSVPVWIEEKPFDWHNAQLYQIMTDRFKNGDTSNDDPLPDIDEKANWQGGDFRGIIEKIEDGYFSELGVDVLWISSPVANTENPGKGMGGDPRFYAPYHSYWPVATGWTDDLRIPGLDSPIERHFGTEAELHELIDKAHEKGIRVMLDFVPNHVHTDSYLWKTYKKSGWFNMAEQGYPANSNGGYTCGWEKPVECWFTDYLADINYQNNDAMRSVIDHVVWMIQRFDIDGLRIDAVRLMEIDFTTTLKTAIQRRVTTTGILFYMIGETFTDEHGKGEIGSYLGESKLDGQFDFPLYHHVVKTFLLQSETLKQLDEFTKENDHAYQKEFYSGALMGNFIGNHDVARALSLANRDFDGVTSQGGAEANDKVWENSPVLPDEQLPFDKLVNGLTFIFTLPGIPIIYQGDEIGMPGANDPDNRRMMLFGDELSVNQKRNLERLRMLGKFRHDHPAMQEGSRETLLLKGNFYAVRMSSGDDTVIAVFNNGDTEITEKFGTKAKASGFRTLFSGEKILADDGKIEFTAAPFSSELIFPEE